MSKQMFEALESRRMLSAVLPSAADEILTPVPPVVTPISPISGHGVTLNEIAGKKFTAVVGSFNYKNITASSVNMKLIATIHWGDGTPPTTGTIVPSSNALWEYSVVGTHTYAAIGKYTIDVVVVAEPILPVATINPEPPIIVLVAQWDSTANVLGIV